MSFYSQNLNQKDTFPAMNLIEKPEFVNAIKEVFQTSSAMFCMAMLGTFLGYWFTVFFIEKQGRFMIQLLGFLFISVYTFVMAFHLDYLKEQDELFALLYRLTFFFANYEPNSTTFMLSTELFPTWMRSSCHALKRGFW